MYDSNLLIFLFGGKLASVISLLKAPQTLLKRNIQKQALPTTKQDLYIYISPNPSIQLCPWNPVLSGVEKVGAVFFYIAKSFLLNNMLWSNVVCLEDQSPSASAMVMNSVCLCCLV